MPRRSTGSGGPGAVPIAEALMGWKRRHPRAAALQDLRMRWRVSLGTPWGDLTRPGSLRAGRLKVEVASGALLGEVSGLRREEFLRRVQSIEPRVREVAFAVGDGPWPLPGSGGSGGEGGGA